MPQQRRQFAGRLAPRDRHEPHRAATPLELFFDLVTVLAVAAAAAGLHHALAEGHPAEGVIGFLFAFFAIWWAWMNYTWFASAYDNGDSLFRILTLVIMAGSLVLATGIPTFFEGGPLYLGVAGYILMRLATVTLWLRAAYGHPSQRRVALRYAAGITAVQLYWTATLLAGGGSTLRALFLLGVVLELAVPVWAERRETTPWHRHHIVERYGLMNIIVLGETLLAAVDRHPGGDRQRRGRHRARRGGGRGDGDGVRDVVGLLHRSRAARERPQRRGPSSGATGTS